MSQHKQKRRHLFIGFLVTSVLLGNAILLRSIPGDSIDNIVVSVPACSGFGGRVDVTATSSTNNNVGDPTHELQIFPPGASLFALPIGTTTRTYQYIVLNPLPAGSILTV